MLRSARIGRYLAPVAVLGVAAVTAEAGLVQPELQINWSIDGGTMNNLLPIGTDGNNDGVWNFFGSGMDDAGGSGITLNWSLTGDPDPLLSGNIALFNNTANTVDVFVQMILPVGVTGPATNINGSAALTLTTPFDGGSMATTDNTALWRAFIDGADVASLFDFGYDLTNPGFGGIGDNQAFGVQGGPALADTIAIELRFTLTPLGQASLTSVFLVDVIPAPGGLLVLASGIFFARRRRR